jgi:hypothetical protein
VLGELDEIEAAVSRERHDLVEGRGRVAALFGVHMEVARVPALLREEHARVLVGSPGRLRSGRRDVAERHDDAVRRGRDLDLGLADDDAPRARCDGS